MRILDLFCGAGGCSVGYQRAGFEVVGVDINPQPNYPFKFFQGDALEFVEKWHWHFDAIHASPPCQAYTTAKHIHGNKKKHPDLLPSTRDALTATGKPWVIENVVGSPVRQDAIRLCGLMFDLQVLRHRMFESNWPLVAPPHPKHPKGNLTNAKDGYSTGLYSFVCVAGHNFEREAGARAMGIDWMGPRHEIAQAIPPAYTEYIGRQLMEYLLTDPAPSSPTPPAAS